MGRVRPSWKPSWRHATRPRDAPCTCYPGLHPSGFGNSERAMGTWVIVQMFHISGQPLEVVQAQLKTTGLRDARTRPALDPCAANAGQCYALHCVWPMHVRPCTCSVPPDPSRSPPSRHAAPTIPEEVFHRSEGHASRVCCNSVARSAAKGCCRTHALAWRPGLC